MQEDLKYSAIIDDDPISTFRKDFELCTKYFNAIYGDICTFIWSKFVIDQMRGTNMRLEAELEKIFHSQFTYENKKYLTIPSSDPNILNAKLNEYYTLITE